MPEGREIDRLHAQAFEYAHKRGWAVFPCVEGGKVPRTRSGFKAGTTQLEQIRTWWNKTPYNIGVWTGGSGLVVIDCDLKTATKRWRSDDFEPYSEVPDHDRPILSGLASWMDELALRGVDWLPTYAVITPSLGVHFYFAYDGDDIHPAVDWRPGVDIRAGGSYVVAAGSRTDVGQYEFCHRGESELEVAVDPAPLPAWLAELLRNETTPHPESHGGADVLGFRQQVRDTQARNLE